MKLMRVGAKGAEKPAILAEDGSIRDLSPASSTTSPGEALGDKGLERIRSVDRKTLPVYGGDPRIGPCVGQVGKFICIGLNYADHAAETGMPIPKEPIIFMKATSAIVGPNDDVVIPKAAQKTDWEVELASSSARKPATSPPTRRSTTSPATASPTTSPSASSRSSAAASGTRARAATPSARSAPGSSPRTRSPTRRTSRCGSSRRRRAPERLDQDHDLRRRRSSSATSASS